MNQLRVRIFGGLVVHRDDCRLPSFPTRKSEGVFAFLITRRGRLVHRDLLCGELWGEHTDAEARKALRTALWRIRSVVEPEAADRGAIIRVEGDQLGLAPLAPIWVDQWELEDAVRHQRTAAEGGDEDAARSLEDAVRLYRGDFLEGHYEEWCFLHRERLRLAFLTGLESLHEYHRQRGDWLTAIAWAEQILRHDPLREHVHRTLMLCHQAMGDRPLALRQYATCARIIREELDIEPMEETRTLYRQIRRGIPVAPVSGSDRRLLNLRAPGEPEIALAEVNRALEELQAVATRLERTRAALRSEPATEPAIGRPSG